MDKYQKNSVVVEAIQYTDSPDNTRAVLDFIGPQPKCPTCNDTGEYETEYGPKGCQACNSRLIAIRNSGHEIFADWGDWIIKGDGGALSVCGPETFEETYARA